MGIDEEFAVVMEVREIFRTRALMALLHPSPQTPQDIFKLSLIHALSHLGIEHLLQLLIRSLVLILQLVQFFAKHFDPLLSLFELLPQVV
jgi:hypothetical protein